MLRNAIDHVDTHSEPLQDAETSFAPRRETDAGYEDWQDVDLTLDIPVVLQAQVDQVG